MPGIEKKIMLQEVENTITGKDVFISNYDRVTVENFAKLRRTVRGKKAKGLVVKKTIAKIAFEKLGMEGIEQTSSKSVFLVAADSEPQEVSKVLLDFEKGQEDFKISGAFVDGGYKSAEYVKELACLPSREQLLASVVGGIKAPITNFVYGLNGFLKQLVVVLNEVGKQKSE